MELVFVLIVIIIAIVMKVKPDKSMKKHNNPDRDVWY